MLKELLVVTNPQRIVTNSVVLFSSKKPLSLFWLHIWSYLTPYYVTGVSGHCLAFSLLFYWF